MTSPLRRKRPTTARSILCLAKGINAHGRTFCAALLGVVLGGTTLLADDLPQQLIPEAAATSAAPSSGPKLKWRARHPASFGRKPATDSAPGDAAERATSAVYEVSSGGVREGTAQLTQFLQAADGTVVAEGALPEKTAPVVEAASPKAPAILHPASAQKVSPLADPFGDRKVTPADTSVLVPPSEPRLPVHSAQRDFDLAPPPSNPIRPSAPLPPTTDPAPSTDLAPPSDPAPMPDPFGADPQPSTEPAPAPKAVTPPVQRPLQTPQQLPRPLVDGASGGNCSSAINDCKKAWREINRVAIHDISLNLSPSINPDLARGGVERPEDRTAALEKRRADHALEVRVFKDRTGQVVAEGEFTNLSYGYVEITSTGGAVQSVPFIELSDDDRCYISSWWRFPHECAVIARHLPRCWCDLTMTWKASSLCHKPLYFEHVQLERYGHDSGPLMQPVLSGAHFFISIAALPYKMGINPPQECQYSLGYYRPGDCAPWMVPPIPLSARGALMEMGVITGVGYMLP